MPKFSKRSKGKLATCHDDLQKLFNKVIERFDCSIICGHRGKEDQDDAFARGVSKLRWPRSKHNKVPSLAVDVVPYPCDWEALNAPKTFPYRYKLAMERFEKLAREVHLVSLSLGIRVRHGADWDMDGDTGDEKFQDWPHWELV